MKKTLLAVAAAVLPACGVVNAAQVAPLPLAITEVMAESSTNLVPNFRGPDYFEVTNYGTNTIPLTGFGFSDNNRGTVFTYPFDGLEIRGGETILFFRSNRVTAVNLNPVDTTNKFLAWWWAPNQAPGLQVRFFVNPGLDGDVQDQVWLMDANSNVVDTVSFGRSTRGRSFAYDPDTGAFGIPSVPGVCGAFRAAGNTNDIGSPGVTCGPVPVSIVQPPVSQTVDGCGTATFTVLARGLPRPKFHWYRDGVCMTGETASTLIIPRVQPSDAGDYHVRLCNGLTNLDSAPAHLSVSTSPLAPVIIRGPVNVTAFPGQTALFSVQARGFPCLEYQWSSNGVVLPGETNQTLSVPVPVAAPLGSTEYCVTVSNSSGATNACARLLVMERPCLCFTEIMSVPNDELALGHFGWFELTNCGTNDVNLLNYRYRDGPNLNEASTITNDIVLRPGQSAVFVEFMSAEAFRGWWGADRLPPDLPVITWGGWGLSGQGSDVIHLWNPAATDPYNPLATASHIIASNGFSQELDRIYDPSFGCVSGFLQDSVAWENGAFPAEVGGDIGSPGYIANPPPRLLGLSRQGATVRVRCRVVAGKSYRLHRADALASPTLWTPLGTGTAVGATLELEDPAGGGAPFRFYQVEELP